MLYLQSWVKYFEIWGAKCIGGVDQIITHEVFMNVFLESSLLIFLLNDVVVIRSIFTPIEMHSFHKYAILNLKL